MWGNSKKVLTGSERIFNWSSNIDRVLFVYANKGQWLVIQSVANK